MEKNKREPRENKKSQEAKRSLEAKKQQEKENIVQENNENEDLFISDDEEGGIRVGDIYIPPPVKPYCSTESKGPRLIITKIVNENFKSYAGKVVLGPFHSRFNAIMGPNGSGKSNVIDSMLFVFGYRAQKIRCKKLSVLLHNSAKYPNTQMCSVAVHFKQIVDTPEGDCEDIPDSEVVIARTAFRDNSSFYTMNGQKVQFKEVSKLLKQHGIDLDHNRFLILQGEVESIAMMKPKAYSENECGMLEYLEDIIGTTRYKKPLIQINARVDKLTEERTEKHNRCKLAEREMKDLEQPYEEAIEHLKKENDLIKAMNLKIQKYLSEQNQKLAEYAKEEEGVQNELKAHDNNANELVKKREEKENLIKETNLKYSKLCKTKEEMEQNQTKASNNYTETQNTMVAINKRRKQNQEQIKKLENKMEDLSKIPKKNEGEIIECEKKVEKLLKEKTKLEEELQKNYELIEDQTRPFIEEREKLETILIDKKKIVEESKAELKLAESELKILQHDETVEKRKYETLKSSFEDSKKDLEEKQKEIEELQLVIPKMKSEIQQKVKEIMEYKKEEDVLYNKVLGYKAEISEKTANLQMAKSNNKVLDSLMREKYEGNIPGIFGRLGDLGGIDAKYDVAISTACGRLDNIVVDTVDTGQRCIEHLKRHDVGRASFIVLEKIQNLQRYCNSKISTPENVPRLFDLVRIEDERVLPAFYFALRDTLVANDLDQGTRIAYGPRTYRVVTLRGELIETSGTMSGGGKTQMRGKMGQKVKIQTGTADLSTTSSPFGNKKDLERLQILAEEAQSRVNYLQEKQGLLEKEINQLKIQIIQKEKDEQKISITTKSLTQQLPRLEQQLKAQKIRTEKTCSDQTKVKKLEKEINSKRKTFENLEKIANEISEKIAQINKKITGIHGNTIKSVQQKIDTVTKQITNLNGNISKLKVEITTSERNLKKTEKQIEDLKEEIKSAEENLLSLKEKRAEYENESNELQQKIIEIKEEIERVGESTSSVRNEITEMKKEENELKLKRIEIEEKIQNIKKKISDVKSPLPSWKNKLNSLKLNEIPGQRIDPAELVLKTYTEDELSSYKLQDLSYQCSSLEEQLKSKKPNLSCIHDYLNRREAYLERVKILEDVTSKRNEMRQLYDDVRKKRYNEFVQGFHIITKKLKEMYQMITQGGDAELELVDSMDPFTEGVSFSVRPPKKTWKNISNLSGGEKTLSSLALVFALHYYKPSPLYFMDEIDAALDFKNISIVAHYIKERTKNAQFIIISLRLNMFELSDLMIGIYKVSDCTSSVALKNVSPDEPIEIENNNTVQQRDIENQANVINTTVHENEASQSQHQEQLEQQEQQQEQLEEQEQQGQQEQLEEQQEGNGNNLENLSSFDALKEVPVQQISLIAASPLCSKSNNSIETSMSAEASQV